MTAAALDVGPAATIDEVIARLDAIIERALVDGDRLGYFAVLYRTVTAAVKQGIAVGRFILVRLRESWDVRRVLRVLSGRAACT